MNTEMNIIDNKKPSTIRVIMNLEIPMEVEFEYLPPDLETGAPRVLSIVNLTPVQEEIDRVMEQYQEGLIEELLEKAKDE